MDAFSPAMPKEANAATAPMVRSLLTAANAATIEVAMHPVPDIFPISSWPLSTR